MDPYSGEVIFSGIRSLEWGRTLTLELMAYSFTYSPQVCNESLPPLQL